MGALIIEKEKIQEMLNNSPANIVIDDFIDQIIITAKIEAAIEQSEQGLGEDFEDLKKEWLKEI